MGLQMVNVQQNGMNIQYIQPTQQMQQPMPFQQQNQMMQQPVPYQQQMVQGVEVGQPMPTANNQVAPYGASVIPEQLDK